jgi:cell division protein FtsW
MKLATTMLAGSVGALLALGMVIIYSSGMGQRQGQYLLMQLAWCGLGLLVCVLAAVTDYRRLRKYSWLLLGVALVLLVLVLMPIPGLCRRINGARRWLLLGGFRLQPSELAKLALIIVLANYCERYQRQMPQFFRGLIIPAAMIGGVLALIFPEPDWGSTILLATVCTAMLLIAGVRWLYFIPLVLSGIGGLGLLLWHSPMRLNRIMAWFHPELHLDGAGYQTHQAIIALGSGGWWGLGLGNGRQKLGFVPEHHTDFILSVIGEELGLVATLSVLAAFIVLVLCGAYIAWHARQPFGFVLGAGLTLMIGLQAFINFGVVTGVLPNKGLPLPFISYGGSNLLLMLSSVGLLIGIARKSGETESEDIGILGEPAGASLPF